MIRIFNIIFIGRGNLRVFRKHCFEFLLSKTAISAKQSMKACMNLNRCYIFNVSVSFKSTRNMKYFRQLTGITEYTAHAILQLQAGIVMILLKFAYRQAANPVAFSI